MHQIVFLAISAQFFCARFANTSVARYTNRIRFLVKQRSFMKLTTAGLCLAIASLAILNLTPCQAQAGADATTSTTTTTTNATPDAPAGTSTTSTKKHRFRRLRAKRAKRVKNRKHRVSGRSLSGGVAKKGKRNKKSYKPYSSAQQKRLDKLDSALSNPKSYKKIPELSTPGTMSPSQGAPGL